MNFTNSCVKWCKKLTNKPYLICWCPADMIIDWTVCNYQESFTFLQTVFKWDGEAKASFFIWIMKKYLNLLHRKGKFYANNKWNIMYHPLSRVGTQTVEHSAFVGYDMHIIYIICLVERQEWTKEQTSVRTCNGTMLIFFFFFNIKRS